ncbi:MAG: hypothetical protein ACOXZ4_07065 [Sphaerochaetaceae bacterium]
MVGAIRRRVIVILTILVLYLLVLFLISLLSPHLFKRAQPEPVQIEKPVAEVHVVPIKAEPDSVHQIAPQLDVPIEAEPTPIVEPPIIIEEPVISESVPFEKPSVSPVPAVVPKQPLIWATKEYVPPPLEPMEEEDDPWADFYVAGDEDYSIFGDETYLVPLLVNDEYLDDINITFADEGITIDVKEFKSIISELLTDEMKQKLFNTTQTSFTLEYLKQLGIENWYDYMQFELHMNFTAEMMPLRILSINRGSLIRYASYGMSGSTTLKPALFSWFANVSMFSLIDLSAEHNYTIRTPASLFSMQMQNAVSLGGIAFDFSLSIHPGQAYKETQGWSTELKDYVSFNGIQGFFDIKPKSLRFIFGNVNDFLGYDKKSIGIALEKRYSYGDVVPKGNQFEFDVVLDEPSSVEVFINEKSVYRRELQAGIYKLRDFVFMQGGNYARVEITPVADPLRIRTEYFTIGYDSRLLAKGDTLYSMGLSLNEMQIDKTTFRINQQIGLSNSLSGSYSLALSTKALNLSLGAVLATSFGSFDVSVQGSYSSALRAGFTSRLSYRVSGIEESSFGSIDVSTGYTNRNYSSTLSGTGTPSATDNFEASVSYSGSLGKKLRFSTSGSLGWNIAFGDLYGRLSFSTGLPLLNNLSVNGSVNLTFSAVEVNPQLRGQISVNYSPGPNFNASASTDLQRSAYLSASIRPFGTQNNSFQVALNNLLFEDLTAHQTSVSFNHSSELYGLSVRQQFSDNYKRYTTSISLNTAFAFAKGMVGMGRSIGDNFLLIKPTGAMKNQKVAVTKTMASEPQALPSFFGVGLYTGIMSHQQNNVVAYGVGDSALAAGGSYIYDFLPRPHQGYAVKLHAEPSYSLVGTLLRSDTTAYSRYTTDLYRVEIDEDGLEVLLADETLYLFTDESGFFFISGITSGEYQFNLFLPRSSEEDEPVYIRFTIDDIPIDNQPLVLVLQPFNAQTIMAALEQEYFDQLSGIEPSDYVFDENGFYRLAVEDIMLEETFWDSYYPSLQSLEMVSLSDQVVGDSFVTRIQAESEAQSALQLLGKNNPELLFNLARLKTMVQSYLDVALPLAGWHPNSR